MSLPVTLPANILSIYGYRSLQGITPFGNNRSYQFGIIDQMYNGAQEYLIGQSVLFLLDNSVTTLEYNNSQYFLIQQQNIILIENIPI